MLEDVIRIFLTGVDTAKFPPIERERGFGETRMDQKSYVTPHLLRHLMQNHHPIKRHEATVHTCQDGPPPTWYVFNPFDLNTPIVVMQKCEEPASPGINVAGVHAEVVEGQTPSRAVLPLACLTMQKVHEHFRTRSFGFEP